MNTLKSFIILFAFLLVCLSAMPIYAQEERGLSSRPKAPTGEEVRGKLWLLTIGINSYISWPKLKTAINDVKAVKNALLKYYYIKDSDIIELVDEEATRQNILNTFRMLAQKTGPDDSLLIYYAGHGHIDSLTGKGSWIPVESGTDDPTSWISNRDITDYLNVNVIRAKHVLLVSDSCFSGDFFQGNRGIPQTINDLFIKQAYLRTSRQAISSGGLEPVSDSGFGGNSVFTHFFVSALKNNFKPYLIPSDIFAEIKAGVGRNAQQLPQIGDIYGTGGQGGGELVLFKLSQNSNDRLKSLQTATVNKQQEIEALRKAEEESTTRKVKEQEEIAQKQAELDKLDKQISEMKSRLGTAYAKSSDSLDSMLELVDQKEAQLKKLLELKKLRDEEQSKRQHEVLQLQQEAINRRNDHVIANVQKYQKITNSEFGQNLKDVAWDALLSTHPEGKRVQRYDINAFLSIFDLVADDGQIITNQARNEKKLKALKIAKAEQDHLFYSDEHTKLMWPKNASLTRVMTWMEAEEWVKKLNYGGFSDWRLPTAAELDTLSKSLASKPSEWKWNGDRSHAAFNIDVFINIDNDAYWSGTQDEKINLFAFAVQVRTAMKGPRPKTFPAAVWPVREIH